MAAMPAVDGLYGMAQAFMQSPTVLLGHLAMEEPVVLQKYSPMNLYCMNQAQGVLLRPTVLRRMAQTGLGCCLAASLALGLMPPAQAQATQAMDDGALQQLASQGDPQAQYLLANRYRAGLAGAAPDRQQAAAWYQKAAEQGHAPAQVNLGVMYANGRGLAHSDERAVHWYRAAAEQGDAVAQNNLGLMLAEGRAVAQDDALAVQWFRRSAEQGESAGQYSLGLMLVQGRAGAQPDAGAQALQWFERAARQGHLEAQFNAAMMHAEGAVVTQSMAQAAHWFEQAALQGHAAAQSNLGVLYAGGQGVKSSHGKAAQWFERAAEQGHTLAQSNLASLYARGQGVRASPSESYFWLLLASAQDSSLAPRREQLAKRLTAAERSRVQQRAAQWKPRAAQAVTGPSSS